MKFLKGFLVGAAITAAIIGTATWYLRKVWFYRDPVRTPDRSDRALISPADGQVMYIKRVHGGNVRSVKLGRDIPLTELTKAPFPVKEGWLVGIYMTPLDVHFNYAPIPGKVDKMAHTPAKVNLPMLDLWEYINFTWLRRSIDLFDREFHFENERNTLFIKGDEVDTVVVEIADKFVNKITPYVAEGDRVQLGQKIGFIERGSQVDMLILKEDVEFKVDVGQQVYGAQTVIATY